MSDAALEFTLPPPLARQAEELKALCARAGRPETYEATMRKVQTALQPSRIERMAAAVAQESLRDLLVVLEHAESDAERRACHKGASLMRRHLATIREGYTARTGLAAPAELLDSPAGARSKHLGTTPDAAQRAQIAHAIVERFRDTVAWASAYVRRATHQPGTA